MRLLTWQQEMYMVRGEWLSEPGEFTAWVDGSFIMDTFGGCAWVHRTAEGGYVGRSYALGRCESATACELRAIQLALDHFCEGLKSGTFSNRHITIWTDSMDSSVAITRCLEDEIAGKSWSGLYPPDQVDIIRDIFENLDTLHDHAVGWRVLWRKRDAGPEIRKADELASTGSRHCVYAMPVVRRIKPLLHTRYATLTS